MKYEVRTAYLKPQYETRNDPKHEYTRDKFAKYFGKYAKYDEYTYDQYVRGA